MNKENFILMCWIIFCCVAVGIGIGFGKLISPGVGFIIGSVCLALVIPLMFEIDRKYKDD